MERDSETYQGTDHDNTEPYHVMMTIRWEWNGTHRGTWSGTIQVVDGASRHNVMAMALVTACGALDVPVRVRDQVVVTAWELAPDTIHVPAAAVRATESAGPDPVTDDALVEQLIRIVVAEPGIHATRAAKILKDYTGDRDPYHVLNLALDTGRIEYKGNLSDWSLVPVVRATESANDVRPPSPVDIVVRIVEQSPGVSPSGVRDMLNHSFPGVEPSKAVGDALDSGRIRWSGITGHRRLYPADPQETTRRQAKDMIETARKDLGMDPS